jgi:hypothetical protein
MFVDFTDRFPYRYIELWLRHVIADNVESERADRVHGPSWDIAAGV